MTQPLPLTVPDLVGFDDLDPFARETTSDFQTLQQDVYHRLLELPGSNLDDITLGIGVMQYLSGTATDAAKLPAIVDEQLQRDSRIDTCTSTLAQQADGSYLLAIQIQVDGSVIGLQYAYSSAGGLVAL